MHYFGLIGFYMLAQFLLAMSTAYIASKSKLNSVSGILAYFALRWPPLALRWFLSLCTFLLLWENPKIFHWDDWLPNYATHLGMSGIFGWVSDSVLDKAIAILFPGINKEIPAIPDDYPTPVKP